MSTQLNTSFAIPDEVAAKVLGVSHKYIRQLASEGQLKDMSRGQALGVDAKDVKARLMQTGNYSFAFEGKTYVLCTDAYNDYDVASESEYFTASAVCLTDVPDDGFLPTYHAFWDIIDDELEAAIRDDSFEYVCDWEHPYDVREDEEGFCLREFADEEEHEANDDLTR